MVSKQPGMSLFLRKDNPNVNEGCEIKEEGPILVSFYRKFKFKKLRLATVHLRRSNKGVIPSSKREGWGSCWKELASTLAKAVRAMPRGSLLLERSGNTPASLSSLSLWRTSLGSDNANCCELPLVLETLPALKIPKAK
jgi:hypothetical protein